MDNPRGRQELKMTIRKGARGNFGLEKAIAGVRIVADMDGYARPMEFAYKMWPDVEYKTTAAAGTAGHAFLSKLVMQMLVEKSPAGDYIVTDAGNRLLAKYNAAAE